MLISMLTYIQGLESYQKGCLLLLFKFVIDTEEPQLLFLNVLSLRSAAYPLSSIAMKYLVN